MRRLNPLALLSLLLATTCFGAVPIYVENFDNPQASVSSFQRLENWHFRDGIMENSPPGGWENLPYVITPKFVSDRRNNKGLFLFWSTRLDSYAVNPYYTNPQWRELNKLWVELRTDSGTAYTFLFKPFAESDLAKQVQSQAQILYKDKTGIETPLAEGVFSQPTPGKTWMRFGVYIAPDTGAEAGRILFFFNNGGQHFYSLASVTDSRLRRFTSLGIRFRTGLVGTDPFTQIHVDSILHTGVAATPTVKDPVLPPIQTDGPYIFSELKTNPLFGFIGEGELHFARKFHGGVINVNDNHHAGNPPILKNLVPAWDLPAWTSDTVRGNKYRIYEQEEPVLIRKVATLNARQDGLGTSINSVRDKITAYYEARRTWHLGQQWLPWEDPPEFKWYSPNVKELIKRDSAQIENLIRRSSGKTLHWEFSNEPNILPVAITPEEYGRLYAGYTNFITRRTIAIYGVDAFYLPGGTAPRHAFGMGALFNINLIYPETRGVVNDLVLVANGVISIAAVAGLASIGGMVGFPFGPWGGLIGSAVGAGIGGYISLAQKNALNDTRDVVNNRMFRYTTGEYLRRAMVETITYPNSISFAPYAMTMHDYPFIVKSGISRWEHFKTAEETRWAMLRNYKEVYRNTYSYSGPPKIWVTEFGNINPNLEGSWDTEEAASLVSDLMGAYQAEISRGMPLEYCLYYKPLGVDEQLTFLPKGWKPKQALVDGPNNVPQLEALYPLGAGYELDRFPCKALNAIGRAVHARMNNGAPCVDYIVNWP